MFGAEFPVAPERMALINVDMQNCFVHGYPVSAPDGLELQERINRLAAGVPARGHRGGPLQPRGAPGRLQYRGDGRADPRRCAKG